MANMKMNKNVLDRKDILIEISKDKMSVTLDLAMPPEGQSYSLIQILNELKSYGVCRGINEGRIQYMINNEVYYQPLIIAEGKAAENGEMGRYEYYFRTDMPTKPKILPDGSVDYLNMDIFEPVTSGQVVARYFPATEGTPGYTVMDAPLIQKKGKDIMPIRGNGFTVSEDGREYISVCNGKIELINGKIEITNIFTVTGDLDVAVGNVRFDGDVYIMGNARTGMSIISNGNVIIDGHVGGVTIRSGKDVVIKQGMQGGGTGYIECSGNISGKFFEATVIKARGEVSANYFYNCDVKADRKIEVMGSKGVILGGRLYAMEMIKASSIGNWSEVPTIIELGINKAYLDEYNSLLDTISKVESEIKILDKNKMRFEAYSETQRQQTKMDEILLNKIQQALQIKKEENMRNRTKQKIMLAAISCMGKSKAIVDNRVYPGVKIIIDGEYFNVREEMQAIEFVRRADKIIPQKKFV